MVVHLSENTAFSEQARKVSPRTACEAAAGVLLFKVTFATEIAILASSKEGNHHPSFLRDTEMGTLSCRAAGTVAGEPPSVCSLGYKAVTANTFTMFVFEQSCPLGFAALGHRQRSARQWLQQSHSRRRCC